MIGIRIIEENNARKKNRSDSDFAYDYLCLTDSVLIAKQRLLEMHPALDREGIAIDVRRIQTDLDEFERYRKSGRVIDVVR